MRQIHKPVQKNPTFVAMGAQFVLTNNSSDWPTAVKGTLCIVVEPLDNNGCTIASKKASSTQMTVFTIRLQGEAGCSIGLCL